MQQFEHKVNVEGRLDHDQLRLRERLILLATELTSTDRQFAYLEFRTGIAAARWEALFLRDAEPGVDMIMAIARHRRNKVEWLITGYVAKFMPQKMPTEVLIYPATGYPREST